MHFNYSHLCSIDSVVGSTASSWTRATVSQLALGFQSFRVEKIMPSLDSITKSILCLLLQYNCSEPAAVSALTD